LTKYDYRAEKLDDKGKYTNQRKFNIFGTISVWLRNTKLLATWNWKKMTVYK